jgi:hypothetical protein
MPNRRRTFMLVLLLLAFALYEDIALDVNRRDTAVCDPEFKKDAGDPFPCP